MLSNSENYTSYKLQHGSKQMGPIILSHPTDGRTLNYIDSHEIILLKLIIS